jgi:carbamoylphosphate synthase small subunit
MAQKTQCTWSLWFVFLLIIENNFMSILGIDTRMLTKKLREHGTMLGKVYVSYIRFISLNKFDIDRYGRNGSKINSI